MLAAAVYCCVAFHAPIEVKLISFLGAMGYTVHLTESSVHHPNLSREKRNRPSLLNDWLVRGHMMAVAVGISESDLTETQLSEK